MGTYKACMYKIKFKYVRYKCMRVKTNEIYSESVGPCPSYTVPAWLTVQQALTYSIFFYEREREL